MVGRGEPLYEKFIHARCLDRLSIDPPAKQYSSRKQIKKFTMAMEALLMTGVRLRPILLDASFQP